MADCSDIGSGGVISTSLNIRASVKLSCQMNMRIPGVTVTGGVRARHRVERESGDYMKARFDCPNVTSWVSLPG